MLNNQIEQRIIAIADAQRAEIAYEVAMNVNFAEFYLLDLQLKEIQTNKLVFNLYKFKF